VTARSTPIPVGAHSCRSEEVAHATLIRNHGRHCTAVNWERIISLKAASVSAANFLMYGAGGGGEYM